MTTLLVLAPVVSDMTGGLPASFQENLGDVAASYRSVTAGEQGAAHAAPRAAAAHGDSRATDGAQDTPAEVDATGGTATDPQPAAEQPAAVPADSSTPEPGTTQSTAEVPQLPLGPFTTQAASSGDFVVFNGDTRKVQSPDQPWSLAVAPANAYARMELRAGDVWADDIQDGRQRVELSSRTNWAMGADVWQSWSFRVAPGDMPSSYTTISQMHQMPEAGESRKPPAWSLHFQNGNLAVTTRGDANRTTTQQPAGVTRYSAPWHESGQWVHMVAHFRFSPTGGVLEMWRDGVQIVDASGISMGYNDAEGPYSKIGLYRAGSSLTTVMEIANVEIGTADLSARISDPLPTP